ncbi:hypothetical protein BH10ACI2_BH10ACI2_18250 [soil metagenome]
MNNGPARFAFYFDQLEKLMAEAAKQNDPALWLYQNNARTTLFMLEGLANLYSSLHNKKRFARLEMHFKLLEDALGAIDYYDGFAKEFAKDKKVSAAVTKAVEAKATEKTKALNKLLIKKNWLGKDANRIARMRSKLAGAEWLEPKPEMKAIEAFYQKNVANINAFAEQYQSGFTVLETQVHELRRKLRWLSIYPQALQGSIQLTEKASGDHNVVKYLLPDIVNSPFNKMPAEGANAYLLMLDRDYFFALSWIISALGKLKDQGLRTVALNEAGIKSKTDEKDEAAILKQASAITQTFFAEKNLDKLVSSVMKSKDSS